MTTSSFASSFTTLSSNSTKSQRYMDSLVPPSRDQFERIARAQEGKEEEIRQRTKHLRQKSLQESKRSLQSDRSDEMRDAARIIQKTFRGYRARRELSGFTLDPSTRWITAIREAQFRETTRPRSRSLTGASLDTLSLGDMPDFHASTARSNWKKLSMVALRAGHDDEDEGSDSDCSSEGASLSPHEKEELRRLREEANAQRRKTALTLGLQYWLEIIDQKHRYGTNLRMYHEEWRKADTNENFFYWLDYGEGRYISLDTCPRERLERDQVRYLSRDERQYYLATVDELGRLCWAKNGEPIDTSDRYRDSIYGIVPVDDPAPPYRPMMEHPNPYADSASGMPSNASASASDLDSNHEQHRAGRHDNPEPDQRDLKKVKQFSATTTLNKLLRKTVRDGTWIFVADTSFRLYIGIKQAGAFQHSSFLQGARISAGGLISIKDGKLSSLSPLSGHYRPPTSNFRAFVRSLKTEGVDVGHVTISKAYAVLLGLETYTKSRRMGKDLMHKMMHRKNKVIHPKQTKKKEEEEVDTSKSAQREREILEREQQQAEAAKQARVEETALKAMEKLHLVPSTAGEESQKRTVTYL
ncbi:IQ calmodulin-binding motif protein [Trichoderma austrokoningii]